MLKKYLKRMYKFKTFNTAASVVATVAVFGLASVQGASAATYVPTVNYNITNLITGGWTQTHITITANQSNYSVRAINYCNNGDYWYGSWGQNLGFTSTAVCRNGYHILYSGFEFSKNDPNLITCWDPGSPNPGECGGGIW